MKRTDSTEPKRLTTSHNAFRQQLIIVAYDVEKKADGFEYREVILQPGHKTYEDIVATLVSDKYPHDRMEAIINNYLADPSDEGILDEFNQMQAWRKEAKALAKDILAELSK